MLSTATSQITMPNQPCFMAYKSATANASPVTFTTEIKDQDANFNATATWTAPISGSYILSRSTLSSGMGAGANNYAMSMISNGSALLAVYGFCNTTRTDDDMNGCSVLNACYYDAADTDNVQWINSGTNVYGANPTRMSVFGGILV